MGELFGLPGWVVPILFVLGALLVALVYGAWSTDRAHRRLAARRGNLDEAQFLAQMEQGCSPQAARFVWQQALPYVAPRLTPHPDDLLIDDLRIDGDDIGLDWPREWARQQGSVASDLPDWPPGWRTDIRHFARWLDLGGTPGGGVSEGE